MTLTQEFIAYLLVNRQGDIRVRRRRPYLRDLGADEYAFELQVRIPVVVREAVASSFRIELPPNVDPDLKAAIEAAGPLEWDEMDLAAAHRAGQHKGGQPRCPLCVKPEVNT